MGDAELPIWLLICCFGCTGCRAFPCNFPHLLHCALLYYLHAPPSYLFTTAAFLHTIRHLHCSTFCCSCLLFILPTATTALPPLSHYTYACRSAVPLRIPYFLPRWIRISRARTAKPSRTLFQATPVWLDYWFEPVDMDTKFSPDRANSEHRYTYHRCNLFCPPQDHLTLPTVPRILPACVYHAHRIFLPVFVSVFGQTAPGPRSCPWMDLHSDLPYHRCYYKHPPTCTTDYHSQTVDSVTTAIALHLFPPFSTFYFGRFLPHTHVTTFPPTWLDCLPSYYTLPALPYLHGKHTHLPCLHTHFTSPFYPTAITISFQFVLHTCPYACPGMVGGGRACSTYLPPPRRRLPCTNLPPYLFVYPVGQNLPACRFLFPGTGQEGDSCCATSTQTRPPLRLPPLPNILF